jgi:hypothetical protein
VLEAEKNEQRQDNAIKEVTAKAPFGFNLRFFKSQKYVFGQSTFRIQASFILLRTKGAFQV